MPTIIDELAMTLTLEPGGFQKGAADAQTASDSLLAKMLANLDKIEQSTKATAQNTARVQREAASEATQAAQEAADAQGTAARRGGKEQEDASKKTAETMRATTRMAEEGYDKVASSIRRVGVELLSMMGIAMSVSAMERLFMNVAKTNTQMVQLAASMNVNVEALSLWMGMAARMGTTAEGVSHSVGAIQRAFEELKLTGNSQTKNSLLELFGVNINDEKGGKKDPFAIMMEIAQSAQRRGMKQPEITERLRGAGMEEIAPMIARGPAEIQHQLELQRGTGNYTKEGEGLQSQKLVQDLDLAKQTIEGMRKAFMEALAPSIDIVVGKIQNWLNLHKGDNTIETWAKAIGGAIVQIATDVEKFVNSGRFEKMITDATAFAKAAGTAATEVYKVASSFEHWGTVMEVFFGIWAAGKVASVIRSMREIVTLGGLLSKAAPRAASALPDLAPALISPPALVGTGVVLLTAAAALAQFKAGDTEAKAWQMGYNTKNVDDFGHPTEFTKDGKSFTRLDVEKVVAERELELERLAEVEKNTKDSADALKKMAEEKATAHQTEIGGGYNPGTTSTEAGGPEMRAFADTIADREAGRAGYETRPNSVTAFGRYQFKDSTWKEVAAQTGRWDRSSHEDQDINFQFYARQMYARNTHGRDLDQDLKDPANLPRIAAALNRIWTSLPGGAEAAPGATQADMDERFRRHSADEWARGVTPRPARTSWRTGGDPAFASDAPSLSPAFGASAAGQRAQFAAMSVDHSMSSQTHIAQIHVHTAATDAAGIARDLKRELRRFDYAAQADTGLA
jgi:hypothetical protein